MTIVAPDVSEVIILKLLVNHPDISQEDLELHLYKANVDPTDNTVIGDLTEATEAGYSSITLTGASWTVSTSSGISTAEYAEQTFTITEAATYYGYYVTQTSSGGLVWCERFDATSGFILPSGGGTIAITPKVTLD